MKTVIRVWGFEKQQQCLDCVKNCINTVLHIIKKTIYLYTWCDRQTQQVLHFFSLPAMPQCCVKYYSSDTEVMKTKYCFAAKTSVIFDQHGLNSSSVCCCVCVSVIHASESVCFCGCNKANPLRAPERNNGEMHLLQGNSSSMCSRPLIFIFFLWIGSLLI